jgi:cobalamin biosynthesis Mg chelatase CobN
VRDFIGEANAPALADMLARFQDALDRGLWTPAPQHHANLAGRSYAPQSGGCRMNDAAPMTEDELDARHAEKMRKKKAARDKIIATKTIEKGC